MIIGEATIQERLLELVFAPVEHPELLPSLLPLIIGAVVIELYLGKHKNERLGWNTSVGNAILWVATAVNLLLTGAIDTVTERYATYFLLGAGLLVGYLDFFHKWSSAIAFRASSVDLVYPLAYVTVIVTKTDMPVDQTVLRASALFIAGTVVLFHAVRFIELPARDITAMR